MIAARLLVISVGVVVPSIASAEPGAVQGACRTDVKALCGSVQPGGGRVRECMKEHRSQLSNECKMSIADRMLEHMGRKANN